MLVPIPLSEERLKERGFNQATGLVHEAGFPTLEILSRQDTEKQSKKRGGAGLSKLTFFRLSKNRDRQ
ncbi:hypothetical protein ACI2OX_04935 [Bacillus sp. N9]